MRSEGLRKSLWLFVFLCVVAYGFGLAGVMFFPGTLPGALLARSALAIVGVALLLSGSRMLLRRDGFRADALGLGLTLPHAGKFVLGVAGGVLFVALVTGVLAMQMPIHWERGVLPLCEAAFAANTYFWTGFGEELIFRGYALIVLSSFMGAQKAVWTLAFLFGFFHLPGMGMGTTAIKMIATTGAMALVFSYSFLRTGTLWTAVGLHVATNVTLHTLTALDGAGKDSVWKPTSGPGPAGYDAGFWTMLAVTGVTAILLSRKMVNRIADAGYATKDSSKR